MKYSLVVILSFLANAMFAQIINSVMVSADTILIADEIRVLSRVQVPSTIQIQAIDYSPMVEGLKTQNMFNGEEQDADVYWMGKFENYENKTIPVRELSAQNVNGNKVYVDTLTLTLYQAGLYTIPSPTPILDTLLYPAEIMNVQSPTVMVAVTKKTSDFLAAVGDSISPDKIKAGMSANTGIIKTAKVWQDYIWQVLLPLILFLAVVIGYLLYNRRQAELNRVLIEKPIAPADYHALKRIRKIEKEQLWKHGKEKVYQSDLTYMIREYLENRYEIKALESTTEEIKKSLKGEVSQTQEGELIEILQIADLVKFAKAQPSEDINESFLQRAKSFVNSTKIEDTEFDESAYDRQLLAYQKQSLKK